MKPSRRVSSLLLFLPAHRSRFGVVKLKTNHGKPSEAAQDPTDASLKASASKGKVRTELVVTKHVRGRRRVRR